MSKTFHCPYCAQQLTVPAAMQASSFSCPTCNGTLRPSPAPHGPTHIRDHRGPLLLWLGVFSLFCFPVVILVSPLLVIVAARDLSAMNKARISPQGRLSTSTGLVLGCIGTLFLALLIASAFIQFLLAVKA